MTYDVIIIGGGPSGLMCAVAASARGARTLLVDKGDKLGRKLGISGGGRCNVTNNKEAAELIRYIPGNGKFLFGALSAFGSREIIAFFEELGISLKEEDRGRMFPVSDRAKTVVNALIGQVRRQHVDIRLHEPVEKVLYEQNKAVGVRLKSGEYIQGNSVVIATGGKSVPYTGSTGDGYQWAIDAGHSITELYPTEVPITSADPFIRSKELQGLSLRNIVLSVWNAKGKKIIEHEGDIIFTHFGISGPAALRCSQFVVKQLRESEAGTIKLTIDLFPEKSAEQIFAETWQLAKDEAKKAIKNVLKGFLPDRLIPLLLQMSRVNPDITFANIPKAPWEDLSRLCKALPLQANGTLSIEEAFVTGGGVNLKEIDPKTMQSRIVSGLFFCGEILDVHGYTGGYNITAAFSTGYAAGKSAAELYGRLQ